MLSAPDLPCPLSAAPAVPAEVVEDAVTWTVTRAWPSRDGADLEARSAGSAEVRAGRWTPERGVELLPAGTDRRLPALAHARREGAVIVHRPGRRAVVRAADGGSFLKVLRPQAAPAVLAAHRSAGAFAAGFALPRVLERPDDPEGLVRFSALPGRTVLEVGSDPRTTAEQWSALWERWAEGWALLPAAPAELPEHGPEAEAAVVERWAAHAAPLLLPGLRAEVLAAAERVGESLLAGPVEPLVLAHRDLHDKQLLVADGRLALLDLDTAARAEAALDLGNLRAHLRLRSAQGLLPADLAARATAVVDRAAEHAGASPGRLAASETAARFRLGCLYLFRPAWRAPAARSLARLSERILAA
ncbi:hypothetical protein [Rathayibacter festucae]|uniref:hypothetical protein n=1 Tax=Rathayibacter festucae TaxID=110937 RepID=UPI002A6B25BB|nr:hypothetical protein [Rathayibacter festucae]MDY0913118.1 hypothetical protein [Rathayibacter festucae]